MFKRTVYFGNPGHLSIKMKQLIFKPKEQDEVISIPVEDIGFIILDHYGITYTQSVMQLLGENKAGIIICDAKHNPQLMMLPLESNTLQQERFRAQIDASEPLKKQLWQQTIKAKIANQAAILEWRGTDPAMLKRLSKGVKSGDSGNMEGLAARHYWQYLFTNKMKNFRREREGEPPNNLLNYGYIVLRSAVARALAGSGLLATLGIHHKNRYNAFCLADDIMEPYRPYVDKIVCDIFDNTNDITSLTKNIKAELLQIMVQDVVIEGITHPLMVGLSYTTASLAACFLGEEKEIKYPILSINK